jgi:uncharacterized protein (DUF983 family)
LIAGVEGVSRQGQHKGWPRIAAMPDSVASAPSALEAPSAWGAALRGARNHCPRCGHKPLFGRYLKPVERCAGCGQDWTLHQADDFPAYIAIFISGHLLAPVLIAAGSRELLPMGMLALVAVIGALVLTMALLQPAKGAVIALQFHWRMHGFDRAATSEADQRGD